MLATFSHTTFPLVGVHATTACATCHNPPYAPSANNYTTVPTTCYGCHVRDFTGATTPVPHTGFATTCDSCHKNTDATWARSAPSIHSAYFALAGAHVTAPCAQCHNPPYAPSANNYISVPTSPCSACHQNDYNTAKTPVDHIASSFPTTCDSCHKFSDATWLLATFTHTTFPLVGVHATTACATCHNPPYAPSANNYTTVPTTCYGCHVRDFTGATTPGAPHRLRRRRATPATRSPTRPGRRSAPSSTTRTSRSPARTSRRPAPSATTRRTPRARTTTSACRRARARRAT